MDTKQKVISFYFTMFTLEAMIFTSKLIIILLLLLHLFQYTIWPV